MYGTMRGLWPWFGRLPCGSASFHHEVVPALPCDRPRAQRGEVLLVGIGAAGKAPPANRRCWWWKPGTQECALFGRGVDEAEDAGHARGMGW